MPTRNAESRFAQNPTNIDISRSKFERNSSVKTSFNAGLLIPFYYDDVLPGDTFKIRASKVVRMSTLITPLMDNLWLDTYWFFVPNRLVWEHWKEFMGENTQSAWLPQTQYSVPLTRSPSSSNQGWFVGSLADYFGIPTGVPYLYVNSLPLRAYALIWNEWFRDQNLQDPCPLSKADAQSTGINTDPYTSSAASLLAGYYLGGYPAPVAKYHDYFTSALPAPQKGNDVTISVTSGGLLPVYAMDSDIPKTSLPQTNVGVRFYRGNGSGTVYTSAYSFETVGAGTNETFPNQQIRAVDSTGGSNPAVLFPANLYAGDSGNLSVATVNQLRTAFQIQRFLEKDARGGTRYIEMLKAHFGVTSPDYRLQRPEYLGGSRIPIRISQVVQNSATDSVSPQGNTAGFSLTTDVEDSFTKSFTEHGMIIGLLAVRYAHSYQQGCPRPFNRRTRFDYYWPVFANLGEQAILNKEIFAQGQQVTDTDGNVIDQQVFGYQEAWADYRYKPNQITGMMRSTYAQSLDSWHLGDNYSALPRLSSDWIKEDGSVINRALAVTSAVSHQFIADIYIENTAVRPMPLYSIPGLIDHH